MLAVGRAGRERQRVAERKAGRRSSRECAFSKLSLGKQCLILRCIPLVCNQDYIIPNPIHFICSAVKPGCFAKNHMPLKNPFCATTQRTIKKKKNLCVSAAIYCPFHVCQTDVSHESPLFSVCVSTYKKPFQGSWFSLRYS